jgi:predicted GH43/DUF377 family glycosyl hydrolase
MFNEPSKDAALLPEKIRGKCIIFHRIPPEIRLCTSEDLKSCPDHQIEMRVRPGVPR